MIGHLESVREQYLREQGASFDKDIDLLARARTSEIDIAIVTALPLEFNAIDQVLGNGFEVDLPSHLRNLTIREYVLSCTSGERSILVGLCPKMGNNASAVISTTMLVLFPSIKHVIICGIAGGVPQVFRDTTFLPKVVEKHVRLGDVVIGTKGIFQYDMVAKTISGDDPKCDPLVACPKASSGAESLLIDQHKSQQEIERLITVAREKSEQWITPDTDTDKIADFEVTAEGVKPLDSWLLHPPEQPNRSIGLPLIHTAKIGSANILLKDPCLRESLSEKGIGAVEMEASGVADAGWVFGAGVLAVRGICDYCDFSKGDLWQPRAAIVAAATTIYLIKQKF